MTESKQTMTSVAAHRINDFSLSVETGTVAQKNRTKPLPTTSLSRKLQVFFDAHGSMVHEGAEPCSAPVGGCPVHMEALDTIKRLITLAQAVAMKPESELYCDTLHRFLDAFGENTEGIVDVVRTLNETYQGLKSTFSATLLSPERMMRLHVMMCSHLDEVCDLYVESMNDDGIAMHGEILVRLSSPKPTALRKV